MDSSAEQVRNLAIRDLILQPLNSPFGKASISTLVPRREIERPLIFCPNNLIRFLRGWVSLVATPHFRLLRVAAPFGMAWAEWILGNSGHKWLESKTQAPRRTLKEMHACGGHA